MKRTKYFNPTPKEAVLQFCKECVPAYNERKNCSGNKLLNKESCFLYRVRLGKGKISVNLIRKHCLQCMSGSYEWVEACISVHCPLYPFRFGTNPNRKDIKSLSKNIG